MAVFRMINYIGLGIDGLRHQMQEKTRSREQVVARRNGNASSLHGRRDVQLRKKMEDLGMDCGQSGTKGLLSFNKKGQMVGMGGGVYAGKNSDYGMLTRRLAELYMVSVDFVRMAHTYLSDARLKENLLLFHKEGGPGWNRDLRKITASSRGEDRLQNTVLAPVKVLGLRYFFAGPHLMQHARQFLCGGVFQNTVAPFHRATARVMDARDALAVSRVSIKIPPRQTEHSRFRSDGDGWSILSLAK